MRNEHYIIDNTMWVRVPKTTARKMYNANYLIIFAPCLVNLNSPWCYASPFKRTDVEHEYSSYMSFDRFLSQWEYYNLMQGTGDYAKFFVTQYDYTSFNM